MGAFFDCMLLNPLENVSISILDSSVLKYLAEGLGESVPQLHLEWMLGSLHNGLPEHRWPRKFRMTKLAVLDIDISKAPKAIPDTTDVADLLARNPLLERIALRGFSIDPIDARILGRELLKLEKLRHLDLGILSGSHLVSSLLGVGRRETDQPASAPFPNLRTLAFCF